MRFGARTMRAVKKFSECPALSGPPSDETICYEILDA